MNKLPNVVALLILTLVTLLIWLTFNVYRSFSSEAPPAVPQEVVEPINPRFDTEVINQMETRLYPQ